MWCNVWWHCVLVLSTASGYNTVLLLTIYTSELSLSVAGPQMLGLYYYRLDTYLSTVLFIDVQYVRTCKLWCMYVTFFLLKMCNAFHHKSDSYAFVCWYQLEQQKSVLVVSRYIYISSLSSLRTIIAISYQNLFYTRLSSMQDQNMNALIWSNLQLHRLE